jgi:hypothetical protein
MNEGEIIVYQADDKTTQLEVIMEDNSVWLTQAQMVDLLKSTKQNISLHINNVFKEGELESKSTVKEYLTVQFEGKRKVNRSVKYYNLDVIISVGYRVKSKRGTQFRIWATQVIREYLLRGHVLSHRVDKIEKKLMEHDQKFDILITNLPPHEGIFYDGQIFDAYTFASELVKSAARSIILIDNYIDETVLLLLTKRKKGVIAIIYTHKISKQLKLDTERHNLQYDPIILKEFQKSHDRFLIIDNKTVYHIGASLKDLGKKWFAFSKIGLNAQEIINRIEH